MQLRDVMTRQVEGVAPGTTLQDAAQKMRSMDIGVLPVCQNDQFVGMITDRDIAVRSVAQGDDPKSAHVSDAMSPDLRLLLRGRGRRAGRAADGAAADPPAPRARPQPPADRDRLPGRPGHPAAHDQLSAGVLEQVSQPNQPHA